MAHNDDLPTTTELERVAEAVATTGFASHEARLRPIIDVARRSGLQPGTVDVLANRDSPSVARARALGRLARSWDAHRRSISGGAIEDRPLLELLDAWNAHQDLRHGEASVSDLAASRTRLDAARASATMATPAGRLSA